jgi:hypothetical protein
VWALQNEVILNLTDFENLSGLMSEVVGLIK